MRLYTEETRQPITLKDPAVRGVGSAKNVTVSGGVYKAHPGSINSICLKFYPPACGRLETPLGYSSRDKNEREKMLTLNTVSFNQCTFFFVLEPCTRANNGCIANTKRVSKTCRSKDGPALRHSRHVYCRLLEGTFLPSE